MIACEQEFLKAHAVLEQLVEQVQQAGRDGQRIDKVERLLFAQLLQMGFHLLQGFVAAAGDGDLGEVWEVPVEPPVTADAPDRPASQNAPPAQDAAASSGSPEAVPPQTPPTAPRKLKRLPEPHSRRYVSIFGELRISRFVYGTRVGQRIEAVPLDAKLGLPAGEFSYVLEDWQQRLCLKEAFREATGDLRDLLGLAPSVRAAEVMNQHMAEFAPAFRDGWPPPPPDEEGELVVFTADGKGVPMRRPPEEQPQPGTRRTKGQKANKKQMAYVGAVYTIDPFVRTADDVVDELARKKAAADRPQPKHKHVAAEMTQQIEGEVYNGRAALFGELSEEVSARNPDGKKTVVALMDGERALWQVLGFFMPTAIGILDLFHVLERLWKAAHVFHAEGSPEAQAFVNERLRRLLNGEVGGVIGGLRQMLTKHDLKGSRRKTLQTVIGYFENNREHMNYDEYLAAGYPIGSGVAEGACRHLVKDRMEQTGMRWSVEGAQAMLHVRALYLNGQWTSFLAHRIQQEQQQLYPYKQLLAA